MLDFGLQQPGLKYWSEIVATTARVANTNASIQDKNCHIWLDGFPNLYHLFEEFRLLFMSTGSIHNDNLKTLLFELCDPLLCY
jgi:hypothetical protein